MGKRKKITDDIIREVRLLFPNHTKNEIHDIVGIGYSSIDRIQAKYKLKKSREHLHNMGVRAGKASNIARGGISPACYTTEAIAKRAKTYKELYRTEDMRVRWGLKQKTKIRLRHGLKQAQDQRWYLRHLGYIIDETNLIAYYTPGTHRATRLEALPRGTTKGIIHSYYDFRPYGGELD